ncbi:MAG TPA: DnaA regulatory inactivator Hda [Pinirhizobacter sp.]|uniref:DnaA regulatory inactivator Hda n=1 Tax=Pinirhizobacter sp. TaxID=2950432 RepID=UPI002CADC5A7|nr:DnaA regulatory inactivator Hda [Pinirhizobacter sp.]HMH69119.1 DnaA regulatory inactivator Hda [Pinirhizobacter sp.]
MIAQLPLALRWPRRQRFDQFHPGAANAAALAIVESAATGGHGCVYVAGPAGSGKTHLLIAACQAATDAGLSAQYLSLRHVRGARSDAIAGVGGSHLLALDDVDLVAGDADAELALFATYNRYLDAGGVLLLAAEALPVALPVQLPDLRSRLGACTQARLVALDDAERRHVLQAQARHRGIVLDDAVLDWMFARYPRDLGALLDLLDRVDRASLAAQRRVTIPFLRSLLREG